MKTLISILCLLLIINQGFSQMEPAKWEQIRRISPTPHDPNFKSRLKSSTTQSFYKQKDKWQEIIDSTWGPGRTYNVKISIFDTYTKTLTEKFDGFNSIGIDPTEWDSIKTSYRSRINDSTSRGAFASLLNHLAANLMDCHVYAGINTVYYTPLNPGTPQLIIYGFDPSHFGAVLTVTADSLILVLRALDNHPLSLKPGDIILGYEGIPWNSLVDELIQSDIPVFYDRRGAESAARHVELMSAGLNWHLFDTIDIIKYTSGDTVHLPTYPLIDLPVPTGDIWCGGENLMVNNEQLPVPGIPFPDPEEFINQSLTHGIVEGTNMGYIYLFYETDPGYECLNFDTDDQFYEAVSSLMETEGLIIDLRLNYGGWAEFENAEAILFNQNLYTLESAVRCNTSDFNLCPFGNYMKYVISGDPNSLYDKPIAVLIGPNCCSMGDITTYLLDYHPMSHFFGKPACASMSFSRLITDFPGYDIGYSDADIFKINNPGTYLNRTEFPVDVPVWFNADDVSNGVDPVVKEAMEWMRNLSYAHDISIEQSYIVPGTGTTAITAQVENPNNHSISVKAYIKDIDGLIVDSAAFFDDGNNNDDDPGDGIWGASCPVPSGEETYLVSVSTEDTAAGSLRTLPQVVRFTTIGPITVEHYFYIGSDTVPNPGDHLTLILTLKNNSTIATAENIEAELIRVDTLFSSPDYITPFGDIAAGENSKQGFVINISEECPGNTQIPILVDITSDGYKFWTDSFSILVQEPSNLEEIMDPITRIYPNPADNIINIEIKNSNLTTIEIYTVSGRLVFSKAIDSGIEKIDISGLSEGMYFVKLRQKNSVCIEKLIVY